MRVFLFWALCAIFLIFWGCSQQDGSGRQKGVDSSQKNAGYQLPPNNPFLIQNSVYPSVHFNTAQSDVTQLPSWTEDINLNEENVKWLPWVTSIGTAHLPYKSGEEALFVAGTNKVGKIRITNGDFSWVDELMIPGFEYETPTAEQITQTVEDMMEAGEDFGDLVDIEVNMQEIEEFPKMEERAA